MNSKSKARAPGRRLIPHFARQDTNEQVRVGKSRGVTPTLKEGMEELAIRSATVAAKKTWFHIIGNPDPNETLTEVGWDRYWKDVEAEYDLRAQPFIEVIHRKHGREHRHRVYSLVRDDGRLVSVSFNYRRNELLSRLCEIANGHVLCPGKHHRWVLGTLAARGIAVPPAAPPRTGARGGFGQDEHQQAERKLPGGDPRPFRQAVHAMYVAAEGDWRAFAARLDRAGITVARGRSALLVIDEASTFHLPLARLLREEGKRAGHPITITSAELEKVFGRAKRLPDELDAVRGRRGDTGRGSPQAPHGGLQGDKGSDQIRRAERQKQSAAEAFNRRMTVALHERLAAEDRRRDRLRRNRARNAKRRRPTLDVAIASLADVACLGVASHIVQCLHDNRVARRTGILWIGAVAAINGLAPVLLAAAAIGFVRRHELATERRRFRADVDAAKAARAGFRFKDVSARQRHAYAILVRALESSGPDPLPLGDLGPKQATAFVAWWVHASDKQRAAVEQWDRPAPRKTPKRRRHRPSDKGIER